VQESQKEILNFVPHPPSLKALEDGDVADSCRCFMEGKQGNEETMKPWLSSEQGGRGKSQGEAMGEALSFSFCP
jgi:hypothetical protein